MTWAPVVNKDPPAPIQGGFVPIPTGVGQPGQNGRSGVDPTPTLVLTSFTVPDNSQVLYAETIELADGAVINIGENAVLVEVS